MQFCEIFGYIKSYNKFFFTLLFSLLLLFLDPGSGMGKNQDPGSGINIPDPQHCSGRYLIRHSSKHIYCDEMQNVTKLNAKVSSLILIWVGVAGSVPGFVAGHKLISS